MERARGKEIGGGEKERVGKIGNREVVHVQCKRREWE